MPEVKGRTAVAYRRFRVGLEAPRGFAFDLRCDGETSISVEKVNRRRWDLPRGNFRLFQRCTRGDSVVNTDRGSFGECVGYPDDISGSTFCWVWSMLNQLTERASSVVVS